MKTQLWFFSHNGCISVLRVLMRVLEHSRKDLVSSYFKYSLSLSFSETFEPQEALLLFLVLKIN